MESLGEILTVGHSPHELPSFAVVEGERITYPPAQGPLEDQRTPRRPQRG